MISLAVYIHGAKTMQRFIYMYMYNVNLSCASLSLLDVDKKMTTRRHYNLLVDFHLNGVTRGKGQDLSNIYSCICATRVHGQKLNQTPYLHVWMSDIYAGKKIWKYCVATVKTSNS